MNDQAGLACGGEALVTGSSGRWHTTLWPVLRDHMEAAGGPKGANLHGGVGESSPGSCLCIRPVQSPHRTGTTGSQHPARAYDVNALGVEDKAILIADAEVRVTAGRSRLVAPPTHR